MNKMKYRKLKVTSLAVIAAGGTLLYCEGNPACGFARTQAVAQEQASEDSTYKNVVVYRPQSVSRDEPFTFNAELQPQEQASIFARASGYIEEQNVDIGTRVKEGDILARLSSPELEDEIAQAKEDITRQKADAKYATRMYDRVKGFRDSGAVSISEIERSEAERDMARASLSALEARLSQLEKEFAYTEVKAPFDGIITRRNVNRGDRITVSDNTPMYEIAQSEELRVVVRVPQTVLSQTDLRSNATLVLGNGGDVIPVSFQRQAGAIDDTSGTLRVEYALDNTNRNLPSGLTGRIQIRPSAKADTITVPANAIKVVEGQNMVMTVDSQSRVKSTPVQTGANADGKIIVLGGIMPNDQVILNPNALLKDGDTVTINTQGE